MNVIYFQATRLRRAYGAASSAYKDMAPTEPRRTLGSRFNRLKRWGVLNVGSETITEGPIFPLIGS